MIRKIHNSNDLSCPLGGQITEVLLYCHDCIYSIVGHFITIALILYFLLYKGKQLASFIAPSGRRKQQGGRSGGGGGGGETTTTTTTTWYEDDKKLSL